MYAKVNGYKIFFDVEGLQFVPDGRVMREKPVCLVMHGGPGGDHTHFMPDLSPLSEYMQLIYIDDRNCGRSDHIDHTTNSIKQNVEDIEALREYLGLDKVFILGQSYGGMKAQYYAKHYPEHLYGAMIIATSPNGECIGPERVGKNILKYGNQEQFEIYTSGAVQSGKIGFEEYMDKMLPLYHGPGLYKEKEAKDGFCRTITNDDVIAYQFINELGTYDFTEDNKTIDLPCLVMVGEHDFICDVDANRLIADAIPGCEFHIIPGASHEVFADCPDIVFPILKSFIDKHYDK